MPRHFRIPAVALAGLTGVAGLAIPLSLHDSGHLGVGHTVLAQTGTATPKKPQKKPQPKKTPTVNRPQATSGPPRGSYETPPRGSFDHGNDS